MFGKMSKSAKRLVLTLEVCCSDPALRYFYKIAVPNCIWKAKMKEKEADNGWWSSYDDKFRLFSGDGDLRER